MTADETITAIATDGISYLITIPTSASATSVIISYTATGAVDVDWGDGSVVEVSATTHSYAAVAEDTEYTIVVTPHNDVTLYPVGVSDSQSAVIPKAVIREATLGTSVTSIGSRAFHYCTNFTKITIPNSATSIGGGAFYKCTSLAEITIPSGVTTIGDSAFFECTGLTKAIFSDNVTYIGYDTFRGCTALVSLTCSATVPPTLGSYAFTGCPARMAIYVPAESINAYKAASGWSGRADYIQAIPT